MLRKTVILGLVILVQAQDLQEGSQCISEGIRGICRKLKVCPSVALHIHAPGVMCSNEDGKEPVVCCTDCHIDDVSNAAVTLDGIVWKTGGVRKSYDKCVEYASSLPYECKTTGTRLAVSKVYDAAGSCHRLQVTVRQVPTATKPAPRVDFPHLALFGYKKKNNITWGAHGFIISPRFLLAPGHSSLVPSLGELKYVAVGINNRFEDPEKSTKLDVLRIIVHPEYKPPSHYNDIALVETQTDIPFGVNVLPICLADQPSDPNIAQLDILAATDTEQNEIARVRKMSNEECSRLYSPDRTKRGHINSTLQFCYKDVKETTKSCQGSSGRPIYISGELQCMNFAVGLLSFGYTCKTEYSPDIATVYTRIQAYLPWIESIVWP